MVGFDLEGEKKEWFCVTPCSPSHFVLNKLTMNDVRIFSSSNSDEEQQIAQTDCISDVSKNFLEKPSEMFIWWSFNYTKMKQKSNEEYFLPKEKTSNSFTHLFHFNEKILTNLSNWSKKLSLQRILFRKSISPDISLIVVFNGVSLDNDADASLIILLTTVGPASSPTPIVNRIHFKSLQRFENILCICSDNGGFEFPIRLMLS